MSSLHQASRRYPVLVSKIEEMKARAVLLGKASLDKSTEQSLDTLLANIIASSAIEDEQLNVESVRSSLAKHLGLSSEQPYPTIRRQLPWPFISMA